MRTVGGALGGQLTATFLASNTRRGLPTVGGFTTSFVMSTCFLVVCTLAALLVPGKRPAVRTVAEFEPVTARLDR